MNLVGRLTCHLKQYLLSLFTYYPCITKQDGPSLVKKIKGSYLFKITTADRTVHEWLVDLKSPPGSVKKGKGIQIVCGIYYTVSYIIHYHVCSINYAISYIYHLRSINYALLTLGMHARSEGYCSCPVCVCVCLCVCS